MTPAGPAIDEGLRTRFRTAGFAIAWRPAGRTPRVPRGRRARIAHLNDEEARVESWGDDAEGGLEVDSGPVGALVILLEVERRGPPARLEAREAHRDPTFPKGALLASWGGRSEPASKLGLSDLVGLARYALA